MTKALATSWPRLRAASPLLMRGFERLGDLVHLRRVDYRLL
jgi:hypothetical protein